MPNQKRTEREIRSFLYEQFARIGKAFAHPRRVELLDLLCQGPRTVEILANEADMSIAAASHHLQRLKSAQLVTTEREGTYITYSIADESICEFLDAIRELAESRFLELQKVVEDYFDEEQELEFTGRENLEHLAQSGKLIIIDVRPEEEYEAGHLPGAISLPLAKLDQKLPTLPGDQQIVAYCRGPYCALAVEAVRRLREHGYDAYRLRDGVVEWSARGLPVETGRHPE